MTTKQNQQKIKNDKNILLVLISVGIGTFMCALDGGVVNIILPVIQEHFNTSVALIEWTTVIYLLFVSILLFPCGRYGDIYGHKKIYLIGFVVFILSSALCGIATSIWFLITSRALQGLGAAMLFANGPAILTQSFPKKKVGRVMGIIAMTTYLGITFGPIFGGIITHNLGWRIVFYINVPIGIIAFILSLISMKSQNPEKNIAEKFDVIGAVLFGACLGILFITLNQGSVWGWASLVTVSSFIISLILLIVFIYVQLKKSSPIIDLSLFKNRLFSAAVASALINYTCLFFVVFLMPFFLIQYRGIDTNMAGLLYTPQPLLMAIMAPISGMLSDRFGSRLLSTVGMALLSGSLYSFSILNESSSELQIVFSLIICGVGVGLFTSPNNSALMSSAPRYQLGIASSIMASVRNFGMAMGIALAGALLLSCISAGQSFISAFQFSFTVGMFIAGAGVLISLIR